MQKKRVDRVRNYTKLQILSNQEHARLEQVKIVRPEEHKMHLAGLGYYNCEAYFTVMGNRNLRLSN